MYTRAQMQNLITIYKQSMFNTVKDPKTITKLWKW